MRASQLGINAETARLLLIVLLLVGFGTGLAARLLSLDNRPLAVDEYYFVRAAEFITDHGVPRFPSGGYYVRGLLPEYLSAGAAIVLGDHAVSHRVPVLLANLLSIFLAYVYCRRFTGRLPAAAVSLGLAVSSWHIEFSHFARMYSAFQCATLLFLIAVDDAYFRGKWHRRYWPHGLAVLGVLTHFLGILLVPALFLPLIDGRRKTRFPTRRQAAAFLVAGIVVVGLCFFIIEYDFRDLGVRDKLPDDYMRASPHSDFWTPKYLLWSPSSNPNVNLALVVGAILIATVGLARLNRRRQLEERDLVLGLLLVCTTAHAFLLSLALLVVLLARYRLHRLHRWPQRSRRLFLASSAIAGIWLVYASCWIVAGGVTGPQEFARSMALTFFGWPQFYRSILLPWSGTLPVIGVLLVAALAYRVLTQLNRPLHELLRDPACVVLWVTLCFSVLRPTYPEIRYAFFIYPVILTVMMMALLDLVRRLRRPASRVPESAIPLLGSAVFLLVFAASSDFNAHHILHVKDEAVVYRASEYEKFSRLWYSRDDFESPAEFIERSLGSPDDSKIIVVSQPPVSYYIQRPHGVYYDRRDRRYSNVSRAAGTVDLWSGQPLLGTPDDLRRFTAATATVWLVRAIAEEERQFDIREVWGPRLVAATRTFVNADRTVEVVRVTLAALESPPARFAENVLP